MSSCIQVGLYYVRYNDHDMTAVSESYNMKSIGRAVDGM